MLTCPNPIKDGNCKQVHCEFVRRAYQYMTDRIERKEIIDQGFLQHLLSNEEGQTELDLLRVRIVLLEKFPEPPSGKELQWSQSITQKDNMEKLFMKYYGA